MSDMASAGPRRRSSAPRTRKARLLAEEVIRRHRAKHPPDCDNVLHYKFRDDTIAKARAFFKGKGLSLKKLDRWHERYGFYFPWNGDYEDLRQNVNRQFAYFPMIIAMCETEGAVVKALCVGRSLDLKIAIRSGAHCMEPFSLSNGIVIDQSRRNRISIHHPSRGGGGGGGATVAVESGVVLGELVDELSRKNLIMAVGSCPNVGMGFFLGGGIGFYGRKFGAGCDQLEAARILLADGRIVTASRGHHKDLLWGLQGAGIGNFGIVLELYFRARKTPKNFYLFKMTYPLSDLPIVLPIWQRWAWQADSNLGTEFRFNNGGARPLISGVFFGRFCELREMLGVFPERHREDFSVKAVTFAEAAEEFAGKGRWPPFTKAKNSFLPDYLPPNSFGIIVDYMSRGNGLSVFELNMLGGAFNMPSPNGNAFVHRRAKMWMLINAHWQEQEDGASELAWLSGFSAAMAPFTDGMLYQNMPDLTVPNAVEKYYGSNLPALRRLKKKYDPDNVFQYAQGV